MKFDPVYVLSNIPEDFISDGCSSGPDVIFGVDLKQFCRAHDAAYCQRLWPPGSLDQEWRNAADRQLGVEIRAALPYVLDWIGWMYWRVLHIFGGTNAFASCGPLAGAFCRHGVLRPSWMD